MTTDELKKLDETKGKLDSSWDKPIEEVQAVIMHSKDCPICSRLENIANEIDDFILNHKKIEISEREAGASAERERILKIIEEHKHKIENDSDFWEKWINETLEQVRAEIEKEAMK